MQFEISREALLKPLQLVAGVIERQQTLMILSHALMKLEKGQLTLTGTDLEVELTGVASVDASGGDGEITAPARKLLDICRSLPEEAVLKFELGENMLGIQSGRSRFSIATLPASDYPTTEDPSETQEFTVPRELLKAMLGNISFAMAQQDVRHYLNGALLEVSADYLRMVATDGHRLAMQTENRQMPVEETKGVIVPRKAAQELSRLFGEIEDENINVVVGASHIRVSAEKFQFTSKLLDGKFPEYDRVIPKDGDKTITADRIQLRDSLVRAAILSNEKYRGIRVILSSNEMKVSANNPDQEEAEATLPVEYAGDELEMGFNAFYIVDILNSMEGDKAQIVLSDPGSSALIQEPENENTLHVVMPMRF